MKTKFFFSGLSGLLFRAPLAAAVMMAAPAAWSDTLGSLSMGQDVSYGGASHPRTVQSALHNPASPAASDRRGVWFGLGGASAGVELGDVSDFEQRLDDISESLERDFSSFQEAKETRDEINAFIEDLGERGYANIQARAQPPLMPLGAGLPGIGGQFSLGVEALANARVEFMDDKLCIDGPNSLPSGSIDNPDKCPSPSGGDVRLESNGAYLRPAHFCPMPLTGSTPVAWVDGRGCVCGPEPHVVGTSAVAEAWGVVLLPSAQSFPAWSRLDFGKPDGKIPSSRRMCSRTPTSGSMHATIAGCA